MTDVPSLIVSVEPVMAQPALGLQPTVTDTSAPEVRRGTVMVFAPTCSTGAAHPRVGCRPPGVARGRGRGAGAGAIKPTAPVSGSPSVDGLGRVVARGAGDTLRASLREWLWACSRESAASPAPTSARWWGSRCVGVVGAETGRRRRGGGGIVAAVGWVEAPVAVASGVAWAVDGVPAVADGTRSMLVEDAEEGAAGERGGRGQAEGSWGQVHDGSLAFASQRLTVDSLVPPMRAAVTTVIPGTSSSCRQPAGFDRGRVSEVRGVTLLRGVQAPVGLGLHRGVLALRGLEPCGGLGGCGQEVIAHGNPALHVGPRDCGLYIGQRRERPRCLALGVAAGCRVREREAPRGGRR